MGNNRLYEFAAAVGTFGAEAGKALNRMIEASKPVIKTFNDLYNELAAALGNKEVKKYLRQQSIRDRKQQIQRSMKRQELLKENMEKSNNWKRLHGLPTKRKNRKHTKKH